MLAAQLPRRCCGRPSSESPVVTKKERKAVMLTIHTAMLHLEKVWSAGCFSSGGRLVRYSLLLIPEAQPHNIHLTCEFDPAYTDKSHYGHDEGEAQGQS